MSYPEFIHDIRIPTSYVRDDVLGVAKLSNHLFGNLAGARNLVCTQGGPHQWLARRLNDADVCTECRLEGFAFTRADWGEFAADRANHKAGLRTRLGSLRSRSLWTCLRAFRRLLLSWAQLGTSAGARSSYA